MSEIAARLEQVRERIAAAARRAGRDPAGVRLIAVAKTFPAAAVEAAAAAGQRLFGENRVQESASKIPAVSESCGLDLEWHFIGPLQRNKARQAVELFDVIHSLDRPALVDAVAAAAARLERRPRVLLQVNLDAEPQKSGVAPAGLEALAAGVAARPELQLAGLMALPRARTDAEAMRPAFARLRELRDALGLAELSMGMSGDFEVAVEEGATLVRLGTAIFGERGPAPHGP